MAGAAVKTGIFRQVPSPDDQRLQRIQDNLTAAIEILSSDHDVFTSPVASYQTSGAIKAGVSIAAFNGGPGQTLTLPLATAQGKNVGIEVLIANTSTVPVTISRTGTDTLNAGLSIVLAARTAIIVMADGISRWLTIAGVTDGDKGDIIVSGGGTVWTVDPAFTASLIAQAAVAIEADLDTASASDLSDLERRFRLLLKRHVIWFKDIPPGLEDESQIALQIE